VIKSLSRELSAWMIAFCRFAPGGIGQRMRLKTYSMRLKKMGDNCYVGPGTSIVGWENISWANNVSIGQDCILTSSEGTLSIGENSGLNSNVTLSADLGSIDIGENVIIGMNTVMRAANHRFDQSPEVPIREQGHNSGKIIIHNDVWIGANVTVVSNVTIGPHCVIGAGSVVTKDIPGGSIAAGVPARVIKNIK
jgi:galactoside O-acetyltransferase